MSRHPRASGFTLLEAMIAMGILVTGAMGLISLHHLGIRMNGDARVITRATLYAQDLLAQMQSWDYQSDARLKHTTRADTNDVGDSAFAFETGDIDSTYYDHTEGDLGADFSGVPTAEVQELGFERYWNVEDETDDQGRPTAKKVAAIVRWGENGRWRRVVLISFLVNSQANLMQ